MYLVGTVIGVVPNGVIFYSLECGKPFCSYIQYVSCVQLERREIINSVLFLRLSVTGNVIRISSKTKEKK